MRKKLLALLMCATMVLGSSAVAFAAPTKDNYDDAKKILEKGEKVVAELEYSKVKTPVYVRGEGGVNYGFAAVSKEDKNTPAFTTGNYASGIRLNDDNKPLKSIGSIAINNAVENKAVINASVTTSNAVAALTARYGADANLNNAKVAYVVNYNAADTQNPVYKVAVVTVNGTTADPDSSVETYSSNNDIKVNADGTLKEDVDFITADGYSYDVDGTITLFEADGNAKSASDVQYAYTFTNLRGTKEVANNQLSVAKALEEGTLTKDAVAVGLHLYQIEATSSNGYPRVTMFKDTTAANTVDLTAAVDALSRTSVKNATDVYQISTTVKRDSEAGAYNLLKTISTGVDLSSAKFTITVDGGEAILIFDNAADASNNDGVSDTTTSADAATTAANNSASPKTGDVAPIAALAVVMMGACGAMVVASKKRA